MVISGIVALTLSPALAALLLKPAHHEKKGFFRWFENAFARMTDGYTRVVKVMIKRSLVALLLFAGMIAICCAAVQDDTELVPAAGGPGLPARRGHHARRRQPRSHRAT